jgi:ribosome-binding factor A
MNHANFTARKGTIMEEGKRQRQVAGVIQQEMNDIFRRLALNMINGGMVSISSVKVTPDLLEARIYLSFYKVEDRNAGLKKIEDRSRELKKELAARVKHQLRRIPVIHYYIDETLEHVFRMEEIFRQINADKKQDNIE